MAAWVVHQPGVHAVWSWWLVSVGKLTEVEGLPPAHLHYPEATFELMILTFDPQHRPDPDASPSWRFLTPADMVHQFHGCTDEQAAELVRRCVEACTRGILAPDSDYRKRWVGAVDAYLALLAHEAAETCPRCQSGVLRPMISPDGSAWEGQECHACHATWMFDVPRRPGATA